MTKFLTTMLAVVSLGFLGVAVYEVFLRGEYSSSDLMILGVAAFIGSVLGGKDKT